jgi:dTDP-4-dehydrorhamnose reductase
MKILITGGTGMLGTAITARLDHLEVYSYSSKDFDITCPFSMDEKVNAIRPDYIINCAAYTAVDLAETEQEKAYFLNAIAVEKLAQIAQQYKATFIHFSTDYVFKGNAIKPYLTTDPVDPINVYGASKLIGEQKVNLVGGAFYIFRISWLYAPHAKNFFKWVAGAEQEALNIVDSQTGSPTSALDIADFIKHLLEQDPKEYGTYHFTNKGSWTWYDFAQAINKKLDLGKTINPVAEFKTAAVRPAYSVMDVTATERSFNYSIPTIEDGLDAVVRIYSSKSN